MKSQQSRYELEEHLKEQIDFLRAACREFDSGKPSYAKAAATNLRVMLHDTNTSTSLLELLGLKAQIRFLDTAGQILDANLASTTNLTIQRVSVVDDAGHVEATYEPVLDDYKHRTTLNTPSAFGVIKRPAAGRRLSFDDWWTMPVIRDNTRTDFSRKDLVLALANQDGGAHVDPKLPEIYHRLSRGNSVGWMASGGGEERPFGSPVPASVRQIAHEFLNSPAPGWEERHRLTR